MWLWRPSVRLRLSTPLYFFIFFPKDKKQKETDRKDTLCRGGFVKIQYVGVSSSSKTQHFDCCIRRFESCHPSHQQSLSLRIGFVDCSESKEVEFFRRSSPHTALGVWVCEVSSKVNFSGTARSGRKIADAEYPATPAKKRQISTEICRFSFIRLAASDIASQ